MTSSNIGYEVVERKGNLDRSEFSICPNCAVEIIKLDDGCGVCGWKSNEKLLGGDRKNPRKSSSTKDNKLSLPCLVKQPKQPELKGLIREVWRDRFVVYIPSNSSTINVSKLYVYPDFSDIGDKQLLGGLNKCSSKSSNTLSDCSSLNAIADKQKVSDTSDKCSSKINPPSKNIQRKTRRRKGEGSGAIFYRTVTKNGRDYQQAYYHWRSDGKQRSKYIPKKLLNRVQEAESDKLPVADILEILQGGLQKCSSKKFDSFSDEKLLTNNQSAKTLALCSSKITSPPCTKNLTRTKRQQSYGAGYIECRKVKRGSKLYSQFWYHYEFWQDGDRLVKKSRYIPKRLVTKVERMELEKVPVREILVVLGVKG